MDGSAIRPTDEVAADFHANHYNAGACRCSFRRIGNTILAHRTLCPGFTHHCSDVKGIIL